MMQPDVARDSPHDNRIRELEAENARLRKIRDSLIAHVESGTGRTPDPYAVFEHSVMLAEQVRERTEALNQLMDDLRESNSALEQARAEAEQANHSKSRFLAAVSHDLLQPLNAARLFTGALEEQGLEGTAASLVRSLGSSLEAVDHLLGTLVDISRLDAGSSSLIRPALILPTCWMAWPRSSASWRRTRDWPSVMWPRKAGCGRIRACSPGYCVTFSAMRCAIPTLAAS